MKNQQQSFRKTKHPFKTAFAKYLYGDLPSFYNAVAEQPREVADKVRRADKLTFCYRYHTEIIRFIKAEAAEATLSLEDYLWDNYLQFDSDVWMESPSALTVPISEYLFFYLWGNLASKLHKDYKNN